MDIVNYILAGMVLVELGYIFLLELLHRKERIDLYNRIMAKDYVEFNETNHGMKKPRGNPLKRNLEHDLIKSGLLKEQR